jgi:hypothetical protein
LRVESEVVGGSEAAEETGYYKVRKGRGKEETHKPKTPQKTDSPRHQNAGSFQMPGGRPVLVV